MIPVSDFSVYLELTGALPSIEEDFFRTPLTEEEREIAIHSCPKTSSMNYNPQPLNDTALSTVKKTNYSFYGIQLDLAQATRPVYYYFHRRIQKNWDMDTFKDPEILFASTIRALLSEITANVTQERYQTADASRGVECSHHKEASRETTANPALSQAPEEDRVAIFGAFVPKFDEKTFGLIINYAPPSVQKITEPGFHIGSDERSCLPDIQESNRKDPDEGTRILKPTILDTEEGSRALTHSRPPKTKSQCGRKEIQDGYAYIHQQNDRSEGFPDVTRPPRCVHIHFDPQAEQKVPPLSFERVLLPVTHPAIRATTEPVDLHEDPLPSSIMCQ
ncbi:hypothetical protein AYI70_g8741, partial [Smittium culicis]